LDSLLDMGSRRILGFALDKHHDAELAHAALAMTVAGRGGTDAIAGVIMHSDQGSEPICSVTLAPEWGSNSNHAGWHPQPDARPRRRHPRCRRHRPAHWLGSVIRRGGAFDDLHALRSNAHRPIAGSEGRYCAL
jgi:hypothetical protein